MENPNPFSTLEVTDQEHFIGRQREISVIERVLSEGKAAPHPLRNLVITGSKGTGKSSLLNRLQLIAEQDHYLCITRSIAKYKLAPAPLVDYLQDSFQVLLDYAISQRLLDDDPAANLYRKAMRRLTLTEAEMLTLSNGRLIFPSWYYSHSSNGGQAANPVTPWCSDVTLLLDGAEASQHMSGCVFGLDNIDEFESADLRLLIDAIQAIYEHFHRARVMFAVAGAENLVRTIQQFHRGDLFFEMALRPWTDDEIAEYVRRPALHARKVRIPDERLTELQVISEGNPRILAHLCSRIYAAYLAGEHSAFEASDDIIEHVIEDLGGIGDRKFIDLIRYLRKSELEDLAKIAPYNTWTVGQVARFSAFQMLMNGVQSDLIDQERRLQSIRDAFVQRGVLKNESRIVVNGTNLERAYLRFRAKRYNIPWLPAMQERESSYSVAVEQAVQAVLISASRRLFFPIHKWARWQMGETGLPEGLSSQLEKWVRELSEGTVQPSIDYRHQLRLMEDTSGHYVFALNDLDSPLLDLVSTLPTVQVSLLGIRFRVTEQDPYIIQLYRAPNDSQESVNSIVQEISSTISLLDLKNFESAIASYELRRLEDVIDGAYRNSNADLSTECLFACIALGRQTFARKELEDSIRWFTVGASLSTELVPTTELAHAHNGLAFVSIAKQDWRLARDQFEIALKTYSRDSALANRAMTIYDIAYVEAEEKNYGASIGRSQEALRDPNSDEECGFLWVKLCTVNGLELRGWDAELARRPIIKAAVYCTMAAVYDEIGDRESCERALQSAKEASPQHYTVLRAWGRYLMRIEKPQEAARYFEQAIAAYEGLRKQLSRTGQEPGIATLTAIQDELDFSRNMARMTGEAADGSS